MPSKLVFVVLVAGLAASGCGGDGHDPMMMGPSRGGPQGHGWTIMSVTPAGGSTGVPLSAPIVVRFGGAMAMGHYVDLHLADLTGPTVPLACDWSRDRVTVACMPNEPLRPRTTYVIHVGGMSFPFTTG
jgi:hypothetical protein